MTNLLEAQHRLIRRGKIAVSIAFTVRPGVECPVCTNRLWFFVTNRLGGRRETMCVRCGSLERHRRVVMFLRSQTSLYEATRPELLRVLHLAPTRPVQAELERMTNLEVVTGDIDPVGVDVRVDLTDVPFPDGAFNIVLCSHVLEHIEDDLKAMSEIHRVLRPDGWALINVPTDPERTTTYEDPRVQAPRDRLEHFGQEDHVRVYGLPDFVSRLGASNFEVTVDPLRVTADEAARHLLNGDIGWDHSYLCRPL